MTSPASVRTVDVLGVRFHALSMSEALPVIEAGLREGAAKQVNFSNAHGVSIALADAEFRSVLNRSFLNLPDGMSIVYGARILGDRLKERVPGPDAMLAVCALAARGGHRVFLMGSSPENLARLRSALESRFPGLRVSGVYSPPVCDRFSEEESVRIIDAIRSVGADLLFVGVSCPKQEKWIGENLHRLPVKLAFAVGAAFDFHSGRVARAPAWFRRNGLEWLYRLAQEPSRLWRRYLVVNSRFLFLLVKARLTRRSVSTEVDAPSRR